MIEDFNYTYLEFIEETIKHYQGLQKRYTKQHNGKHCKYVALSLYALEELKNKCLEN